MVFFRARNMRTVAYKMHFTKFCTCSEEVTNLLILNLKGELIHAAINYTGIWHNSLLDTISSSSILGWMSQ